MIRPVLIVFFLSIAVAPPAAAFESSVAQPYLVETKVQNTLDTALSRMIPTGKFLVQVNADVSMRTERRLVEGETVDSGPEEEDADEKPKEIMPGFLPEYTTPKAKKERASQNRQVFRMVETPVMNLLRVHVAFDEKLDPQILQKARQLVSSFLSAAYPNRHVVSFGQVPMLKTREEIEAEREAQRKKEDEEAQRKLASQSPPTPEKAPKELVDPWKEYFPWIALGTLTAILLALIFRRGNAPAQTPQPQYPAWAAHPPAYPAHQSGNPAIARNWTWEEKEEDDSRAQKKKQHRDKEPLDHDQLRKEFLEDIISQSDTFRLYYLSLNEEMRDELYAILKGPAYEKFLEGLGLRKPAQEPNEPHEIEKRLDFHEKRFEEFTKTKEWQDKQFFGFLQRLNEEQIITLVNHEDPFAVCVMLRFMKPNQSALVLDALPAGRRVEVLKHVNDVQTTSFNELSHLEQTIRTSVKRLPEHFFGSRKEDITYWTRVLDEAQDQDGILHDLEHTQPGIFPELAKARFKLDDAASVDPQVLKKVLSEADNEELALALISCPQNVQKFILERMSPRRRALLEEQLETVRGAAKDQIVEARLKLTKRFREALA